MAGKQDGWTRISGGWIRGIKGCLGRPVLEVRLNSDVLSSSHTAICPFYVYWVNHIYHSAILLMSESSVHFYKYDS